MMFFFRRKTITLDCFTSREGVITSTPITPAIKHIPDWWKQLPKQQVVFPDVFPSATMRTCTGMVDFYSNAVAIPLWSELLIHVYDGTYQWQFADRATEASVHSALQRGTYLPETNYGHIKIHSPWLLSTDASVSWVWTQPIYSFDKPEDVIVLPGVNDFSKQCSSNINLMIPLHTNRHITVPVNQDLVHMFPMSDKKVEVKRHLISQEEYKRRLSKDDVTTFISKYKSNVRLRKMYSDCPFSRSK
jgi:hypothetical protein